MDGESSPGAEAVSFQKSPDLLPYGSAVPEDGNIDNDQPGLPSPTPASETENGTRQSDFTAREEASPTDDPSNIDTGAEGDSTSAGSGQAEESPSIDVGSNESVSDAVAKERFSGLTDQEKFKKRITGAVETIKADKDSGFFETPDSIEQSEQALLNITSQDSASLRALIGSLTKIAETHSSEARREVAKDLITKLSQDITISFNGDTWTLAKLNEKAGTAEEAERQNIDRIKSEGAYGYRYSSKTETEKDTRTDQQVINDELDVRIQKLNDKLKGLDAKDPKRKQIEEQLDILEKIVKPAKGELGALVTGGALRALNESLISEYGIGLSDKVMQSIRAEEDIATAKFIEHMNLRGLSDRQQVQLLEFARSGRIREFISQPGLMDARIIGKIYGKEFKTTEEANKHIEDLLGVSHRADKAELMKKYGKRIGLALLLLIISGKLLISAGNELAIEGK
jgi:hypothetical protein